MQLDEPSLMKAAKRETGLEDFGDEAFLPPLRVLLHSLRDEAALNDLGRQVAWHRIVGSLKNRLWMQACLKQHPEIERRPLPGPLVIVGPHRSGTTRLHRMLASDSRWQHLSTWEGMNPAPRRLVGGVETADSRRERRSEAEAALRMRHERYPLSFTMHPMQADWPEEEMLLMNHAFCSFSILGLYHVPSYERWFMASDKAAAYRDLRRQLQLVAWSRGAARPEPWVLKNPQHLLDLPALLREFPGARLVFTHRDSSSTVGSVISLMWHFASRHSDSPSRARIRDTWMGFCEQSARRCLQARAAIARDRCIDVRYEDMNRDWPEVMRRIYALAGRNFDAAAHAAMAQWRTCSEREADHRGHRYSLEDFGLTAAEVHAKVGVVWERIAREHEHEQSTGAAVDEPAAARCRTPG